MKKNRILALLLGLVICLTLVGCGNGDKTQNSEKNNTTEYESENLGFSISMNEDLFSVITFDAYKEGYDSTIGAHKWKNTICAEFDGVMVPLFYVNVFDGEFDEAAIRAKFADAKYLGTAEGYTYTMTFSVNGDGAELKDKTAYQEMMDKYVYDLADYTVIYGKGYALIHDEDNNEPKLAWVKAVNSAEGSLSIDPVLMVLENDTENINKMKAAGINIDFAPGYMIWNEKEEQAEVTLSEDAGIFLLDENFNFSQATANDLQSRLEQGDCLISYKTENGKIVEIYEQYLNVQGVQATE